MSNPKDLKKNSGPPSVKVDDADKGLQGEEPSSADIAQVVDSLPPEQKTLVQMMVTSLQLTGKFSPESSIAKQFKPEHIKQYLDGAQENMRRDYQDKRENRLFTGFILVAVLFALGFVIIQLKNTPDVMEKIIYAVGGLIAGALGGYGYGKTKKEE